MYVYLNGLKVTFQAKMAMPDFQRYPAKLCLIKTELDINMFKI